MKNWKHFLYLLPLLLLLILVSIMFYKNQVLNNEISNLRSQTLTAKKDNLQILLEKISKIMVLPDNETPTLATISDKDKLNNQPFFQKAKNGDIVLLYMQAKKAILYDPVAERIIDVSPISLPTASPASITIYPSPTTNSPASLSPIPSVTSSPFLLRSTPTLPPIPPEN